MLFDFDHTLFDSDASEAAAFVHALLAVGVGAPDSHFETYKSINGALWSRVEAGEITPAEVHSTRFDQLAAQLGIERHAGAMANAFVGAMGANGDLYHGARSLLESLSATVSLAMVTNALSAVQRARIDRLEIGDYFDAVVISEEVGVSKPGTAIFDIVFDQLGYPDRETVLMVGDSLTSDMRGGSNYGLDTCWYNPYGRSAGPSDNITHEVASLGSLVAFGAGRQPPND